VIDLGNESLIDTEEYGMAQQKPGVGVGVIIQQGGKLLLVRRTNHGAGTWSTPGGYLDAGESPEACAIREVREETGVELGEATFLGISNDVHPDGKHNITIWMSGAAPSGEPTVAAEGELDAVEWFAWDALPEQRYHSFENFVQGRTYPAGLGPNSLGST